MENFRCLEEMKTNKRSVWLQQGISSCKERTGILGIGSEKTGSVLERTMVTVK